jgi:hypothetical protein
MEAASAPPRAFIIHSPMGENDLKYKFPTDARMTHAGISGAQGS